MTELVDPNVVAVDTETTSLAPDRRVWEVSLVRPGGAEVTLLIDFDDFAACDSDPLAVGGFHERWEYGASVTEDGAARVVQQLTRELHFVGANPAFDAEGLAAMLRRCNMEPQWQHRMYDVSAMGAVALQEPIRGLRDTAMGLEIDLGPYPAHTAAGDARLAMECYRRLMTAP